MGNVRVDDTEIMLKLGAATFAGGLIGLNRDLHDKPSGLRTLALVALGSALAVVVVTSLPGHAGDDAITASRVIPGILTGIGFLGAGVIIKDATSRHIEGLTTAASVWLTACVGVACGLGAWVPAATTLALASFVLMFGGRIEKFVHRRLDGDGNVPGV